MVIDFHCHVFPDEIAQKAVASLEKSSGLRAVLDGSRQQLIKSMKRAGVYRSVVMPIATKAEQVVSINRFALSLNGKDGLLSFGSIHPAYENWKKELHDLKSQGIIGIKLHPDFQGCFIDDGNMIAVLHEIAELKMFVLVHGGYDPSFLDVHRCTPARIVRVLSQCKGLKLIVAHLGGYGYLDDAEKYLIGREDVWIDTSFQIGRCQQQQAERILTNHPPERILFGTDSPWDDQATAIQNLCALNIPASLKERILCQNALDILQGV